MKAITERAKALAAKPDPFTYHAPSTQRYSYGNYNTGVRGGSSAQYGVGSDYHRNLDEAGKRDLIAKYGRDSFGMDRYGNNAKTSFNTDQRGTGRFAQKPTVQRGKFAVDETRAAKAEASRQRKLDLAYGQAAANVYAMKDVKDQAILDQLGKAPRHHEWKEILDQETGNSLGYRTVGTDSGRGGVLKRSWENNQTAWQTGIGAVTGLITGGPVGMVVGGAAGYAKGSAAQKAQKAQRKAERQATKQQKKEAGVTPRGLRDVARSRAAGAGTFNYTEQVGG